MTAERLTVADEAALWRRHFAVYDDLVFGFLLAEDARVTARQRHWSQRVRRWRPPGWYRLVWEFWHALRLQAPSLVDRYEAHVRRRHDVRDRSNPAAVSMADLRAARYALSTARFASPTQRCFRHSDPLDELYVGRAETSFVRTRREVDGEWA